MTRKEIIENAHILMQRMLQEIVTASEKDGVYFENIHFALLQTGYISALHDIFDFSEEENRQIINNLSKMGKKKKEDRTHEDVIADIKKALKVEKIK